MIFFKKVLTFILVLMFYQQDVLMMQQEIPYKKINKLIEKLKKNRIDKSNYKDVVSIIIQGTENKRGMRQDVSKFFDKLIKKDQGAEAVIFVAVRFVEDGNWECAFKLFNKLVEKNQGFKDAANAVMMALGEQDWGVRYKAFDLLLALLDRGEGFREAIEILESDLYFKDHEFELDSLAYELIQMDQGIEAVISLVFKKFNKGNEAEAFFLLKDLLEKDYGVGCAIELARKSVRNKYRNDYFRGLMIFGKLVEKGFALKDAKRAAKKYLMSKHPLMRSQALDLFRELVKKDLALKKALRAAMRYIYSKDPIVRSSAVLLFSELFKKAQGVEQAIKAIRFALTFAFETHGYYSCAFKLVDKLFENGQGFEQIIELVKIFFNNESKIEIRYSLQLLGKLVENDQAFELAKEFATRAIEMRKNQILVDVLKLLGKLVEKKQAFEIAKDLVIRAFEENKDMEVRDAALKLLGKLVEKNQAFEIAKDLAIRAFEENKDMEVRVDVLKLLGKLVEKNQAFEIAKDFAIRAFEEMGVVAAALKLLGKLVEKDFAFEQALDVAIKGVNKSYTRIDNTASIFKLLKIIYEKEEYKNIEISISENVIGKVHKSFIKSSSVTIRDLLEDLDEVAVVDLYPFFEKYTENVEISFLKLKNIVKIFIHFLYTNKIEIPDDIKPSRFLFDIILDLADFLYISKYDMLRLLDQISTLKMHYVEYDILREFVDRDFIYLSKVADENLPFILDRVIELSKKCYGLIADKHETLCEKIKNIRIKKGISYKSEDSDLYESYYYEDSDSCSFI